MLKFSEVTQKSCTIPAIQLSGNAAKIICMYIWHDPITEWCTDLYLGYNNKGLQGSKCRSLKQLTKSNWLATYPDCTKCSTSEECDLEGILKSKSWLVINNIYYEYVLHRNLMFNKNELTHWKYILNLRLRKPSSDKPSLCLILGYNVNMASIHFRGLVLVQGTWVLLTHHK